MERVCDHGKAIPADSTADLDGRLIIYPVGFRRALRRTTDKGFQIIWKVSQNYPGYELTNDKKVSV
jgi:hypothetical protein